MGIVDRLEVVDVEEDDSQRLAFPRLQGGLQPLGKACAVEKAGHRVVPGEVLHALLGFARLARLQQERDRGQAEDQGHENRETDRERGKGRLEQRRCAGLVDIDLHHAAHLARLVDDGHVSFDIERRTVFLACTVIQRDVRHAAGKHSGRLGAMLPLGRFLRCIGGFVGDQRHVAVAVEQLEAEDVADFLGGFQDFELGLIRPAGGDQFVQSRHRFDKVGGPAPCLVLGVHLDSLVHRHVDAEEYRGPEQHHRQDRRDRGSRYGRHRAHETSRPPKAKKRQTAAECRRLM